MDTPVGKTERRTAMCRYQGETTGERAPCVNCGPGRAYKKFKCMNEKLAGKHVTFLDCQTCEHYIVAGLPTPEEEAAQKVGKSEEVPTNSAPAPATNVTTIEVPSGGLFIADEQKRPTVDWDGKRQKLVVMCRLAPGDCLVLTAALESLAACYPGRFEITMLTTTPEVFENNPHVARNIELRHATQQNVPADATLLDITCPLIVEANRRPLHVLEAFVDYFRCQLNLPKLFLTTNRPKLYFSEEERNAQPLVWDKPFFNGPVRYWLINSGVKKDIRTKRWPSYQEVVNSLFGKVVFVQVGKETDEHAPLLNVLNMLGKTTLRQLINMARHAEGVLSGISFLMHAAAALEKPAVIVAGGIEGKSWNLYPEQRYLDTIGQLDCCKHGGCGRSVVKRRPDIPAEFNLGVCLRPLPTDPDPVGACMGLISPRTVVEAIENYYLGGALESGMVEF